MLMNVLNLLTTVTWTMPTALTPLVASPALASMDSLVMELTAQVSLRFPQSVVIVILHYLYFSDINECKLGTDDCHPNATCTDTVGSFDCSCNSGFTGNGMDCFGEYMLFA